jgi:hypothetical protein
MIGPEVQGAIVAALSVAPAIAGGRIHDRVPESPVFPYVSIGAEQAIDDSNSCGDGWEVFSDVHVWSRAVGYVEAKRLVAQAVDRIKTITAISGFTLVAIEVEDTRVFRDPDGLTSHGVVSTKFIITQA